jgi:HK97 gp10 family phage protein
VSPIKVDGFPELEAALAKKVTELRDAAEEAVRLETDIIRDDAVKFAPRDSGELEAGIRGRSNGLGGTVRATARHSTFVEHGTSSTKAQPFMTPAAKRARRRFPERAADIIRKALGG